MMVPGLHRPFWLRKRYSQTQFDAVQTISDKKAGLHTVCEEACCPNIGECFSAATATFLILGNTCTRDCRFCAIHHGAPLNPDKGEPRRVANMVGEMGLKYAVITSVTRDDLEDGGASHFAETIREIYSLGRGIKVEVLIPDFAGKEAPLNTVLDAGPTVISHNVETVRRLYPAVRPGAIFERSIELLRRSKKIKPQIFVKSGFMLGLGETEKEVLELLVSLRGAGCDILTIGQYLPPRQDLFPVARYVHPEEFERYRVKGLEMGFTSVAAGPFVRSSYHASELI
ncbi:MAG: lipoyl synthase [Syntrophales bacterium]